MRAVIAAVALAMALSLIGTVAMQVAGDVGPGQNRPGAMLFQVAGDVGPGQN